MAIVVLVAGIVGCNNQHFLVAPTLIARVSGLRISSDAILESRSLGQKHNALVLLRKSFFGSNPSTVGSAVVGISHDDSPLTSRR